MQIGMNGRTSGGAGHCRLQISKSGVRSTCVLGFLRGDRFSLLARSGLLTDRQRVWKSVVEGNRIRGLTYIRYGYSLQSVTRNFTDVPLTPAVFHILLALSTEERHGYGIMKQVEGESQGK